MPVTEIPVAANDHKLNHHLADKVADNQSVGGENIYSVPFPDKMRNRYNYDARSFEQVPLSNGKTINIARPSATDLEQTLHMEMTGTPKTITDWTRYVVAILTMRHGSRALVGALNKFDGFPEHDNIFSKAIKSIK